MKRAKNKLSPESLAYIRYADFWDASPPKRTSNYTGGVFVTRKDRRMNDKQFLKPRVQARRKNMWTGKLMRRAKPIGVYHEEDQSM